MLFSHGASNSRGICVMMQKGFKKSITNLYRDKIGRIINFNYKVNGVVMCICCIYAPNLDKPNFFSNLFESLSQKSENLLVIGDLNLVMNTQSDRIGSSHNNINAREVIRKAIDELNLCELWRDRNPNERRFLWYRCKAKLSASRIDFSIVSKGILTMCENIRYFTGIMSDHLAHFIYFNIMTSTRGPGYWKLNTRMLRKIEYVNMINSTIQSTEEQCTEKKRKEAWEYLKYKIREVLAEFTRNSASEVNLIISQLSEKLDEMQQNLSNVDVNILEKTKIDLDEFVMEKVKGCIFRSKVNYAEMGEKPTKYFLNMEKARYNAKTCYALFNKSNKLVTDTNRILSLQEEFYRELYTSDKSVRFSFDKQNETPIPQEIRDAQNTPFTEEEIQRAIKQ